MTNAYYEIPLAQEREHAHAEVETSIAKGHCYCHISMHSEREGHSARPCHFCEAEVNADLQAQWDEEEAQAQLQAQLDQLGKLGPLEIVELERNAA